MFIKTVTPAGQVRHHNWTKHYMDIRAAAGIQYPGYMIHESAQWSPIHRKWFFLPRRASHSMYTEKTDERCAANILIVVDENFTKFETKSIGTFSETRGFSAFQFVPETGDRIIFALKSEEDGGEIASYFLIFDWLDEFKYLIKLEYSIN
uniref:Uncharacterized protein n=1 Tax=Romanomermis culicivorax TaxID=13658 RepID=A0A915KPA3_ROMCU